MFVIIYICVLAHNKAKMTRSCGQPEGKFKGTLMAFLQVQTSFISCKKVEIHFFLIYLIILVGPYFKEKRFQAHKHGI